MERFYTLPEVTHLWVVGLWLEWSLSEPHHPTMLVYRMIE